MWLEVDGALQVPVFGWSKLRPIALYAYKVVCVVELMQGADLL